MPRRAKPKHALLRRAVQVRGLIAMLDAELAAALPPLLPRRDSTRSRPGSGGFVVVGGAAAGGGAAAAGPLGSPHSPAEAQRRAVRDDLFAGLIHRWECGRRVEVVWERGTGGLLKAKVSTSKQQVRACTLTLAPLPWPPIPPPVCLLTATPRMTTKTGLPIWRGKRSCRWAGAFGVRHAWATAANTQPRAACLRSAGGTQPLTHPFTHLSARHAGERGAQA